ncbi:MAG: hypothetical protein K8R54_19795 [Bacteroidales bacterium]|nr:hypothetical protein [Bacteroidales bacterium]
MNFTYISSKYKTPDKVGFSSRTFKKTYKLALIFFILFLFSPFINFGQKTVHVFVALCDNENQGIVPVPEKIGNGKDPLHNLYWGAGYGVKNYFDKKSSDWKLIKIIKNPTDIILERLIFKHNKTNTYLLADAYDGAEIKQTVYDFLNACSGKNALRIKVDSIYKEFGGSSDLCAYIGHNGLMDFRANIELKSYNTKEKDAIIIGCYSKEYFYDYIKDAGANPLIWSVGLMSAEAYTLEWALDGWVLNETDEQIRTRAAKAYNYYQKCGIKGARNLLRTGW